MRSSGGGFPIKAQGTQHENGDVLGIAVDLAVRVEQQADAGELWASSTVHDPISGRTSTSTSAASTH